MKERLESRGVQRALICAVAVAATLVGGTAAYAQSAVDEIQRYRQMLQDGNPAELLVIRGEDLWRQKRGPNMVSLDKCDLGLGPGVVKGAYARLPRYFDDAKRVMDLEARLVYCQVTLQGFKEEDLTKSPFSGSGQRQTDNEALVAFVVERSRGDTIQVSQEHPMEKDAYARGKQLFYYRGGPFYFSCATCHSEDDKRIRLQDLPNLEKPGPAQRAYATWPAYRVSQGAMRTMQWRVYDCFRQQRFPELKFTSQASIDLITYLAVNANGGKMDAPAIKR
jgi:sulfur-oxidizing protein SoxA